MQIVRLAWDYPMDGKPTYGLQPVYTYLSKAQKELGNEVHVVTLSKDGYLRRTVDGIHVYGVPPPFNLNAPKVISSIIKNKKESVVHSHATCGIFMYFFKRFQRIPLVSHVHGTSRSHHTPLVIKGERMQVSYSSLHVNYHMIRERILWSTADRVLTVSKGSARDVIQDYKINEDKVRVVYNGVDTNIFRPTGEVPSIEQIKELIGKRIILYVGHFGVRKGILFLIRALGLVVKEFRDVHLLCIGGVPPWLGKNEYWEILEKEIEANRVSNNVTLLDRIPNQELPSVYSLSEIFVIPSYYETFSKVTLEAMACEKPVIATNMGGLPEVVEDGVTGRLVPFGSVKALADSILELLNDSKKATQMGREGRKRVLAYFTWQAVAHRIQDIYNELFS